MALQKAQFKPGINREGTAYDNEGGWFDCNLVRFRMGHPEKFGGWSKLLPTTYQGTARALHNWISLAGTKFLGIGTHFKYYIVENNASFSDITPIRKTSTNSITFSATNGSSELTVTDSSHGAVQNDFVSIEGAVSLGGNITAAVLNQEYQITTIVDGNSYKITAKDTSGSTVTANSSDSGNGGSGVDGYYQINTGLDLFVQSTGWGVGAWGAGGWGSSTPLSATNQLRLYTHDNYGEDLVFNVRGGGIYRWDQSTGLPSSAASTENTKRGQELSDITGANLVPTLGLQVLTSEIDRHLIVLGADPLNAAGTARTQAIDPMFIAFSDQEDLLEFEPKLTNTAGSLRLSSGSQIMGAVKSRQEIIIFTDTSVYNMQFVGPPFTFAVNLINESTGLVGPKAAVTAPDGVYFMSYDSFYTYNGTVSELPCTVKNYVFSDINNSQIYKVQAFTNNKHSEVGWYYPSASSSEIDRYVIYNYRDKIWYYGQLSRTVWLDAGIENYPQAASGGYLYEHEDGFDDDGSEMTNVFIESSDFDIGEGDSFSFIRRLIPDIKFLDNDSGSTVNIVTKTRNFPGDSLSTADTSTVTPTTQQAHIRARGRQIALRIASNDGQESNQGVGWRYGSTRYDVVRDGRR
tara:strand:+ start:2223 stop:4118 length:1896 start_codon:yes stop_codon:yes gene_type:complete